MKYITFSIYLITISLRGIFVKGQASMFDQLNSNSQFPQTNFESIVQLLKDKVTNSALQANFTTEKLTNAFASLLSGNEYLANVQGKDFASFKKAEVRERLKIAGEGFFEDIKDVRSVRSEIVNITDSNEIILDPEAVLKIAKIPLRYKVRDIFEVIAFMKYIIKICGNRLEKCEFAQLKKEVREKEKATLIDQLKEVANRTSQEVVRTEARPKVSKNLRKQRPLSEYKFKEAYTNNIVKEESTISKEIESQLDFEFKRLQELLTTAYEKYMSMPLTESIAHRYYYGGI